MRISLDYDATYTVDPVGWNKFIDLMQLRDHEVVMVTFRGDDTPVEIEPPIKVYYTGAKPKRWFMNEVIGLPIDVWIDDYPDLIVTQSEWTDEQRDRWRQDHKRIYAHD